MNFKKFSKKNTWFLGERVRVDALDHGVMHLVFTRPDVRNAFDPQMIQEISSSLQGLAQLPPQNVRVLLISGEGSVFCAGADLAYMKQQAQNNAAQNYNDARKLGEMFYRLAQFPTPVITAVQGAAIGGGLGLTVCSDHVVASEKSVFATTEVKLGILPAVIGPYIVRKIGLSNAAPLMLSGEKVDASHALHLGLAQKVISQPDSFEEHLETEIFNYVNAGPEAVRRTKNLLLKISPLPDPTLFEYTARQIADARCSEEGQEGLNSFFEKKKTSWSL